MKVSTRRVRGTAVSSSGRARNAAQAWVERTSLHVELTHEGAVGRGEAAPLPGYSTETLAEVETALDAFDWLAVESLEEVESACAALPGAARFAAESALLSLAADRRGVPLWRLLGEAREAMPIASALFDDEPPDAHAPALKVKVGARPLDEEMHWLRGLRVAIGERPLRLDANRAVPESELLARLDAWATVGPEMVEEPSTMQAIEALPRCPVPLAADESLVDDAERALGWPHLAALVLKPARLGLIGALRLAARADARAVVISHLLDGPIARAACAHLALVVGTSAAGLGEHPFLAPLGRGLHVPWIDAHTIRRPREPGLGVHDAPTVSASEPDRLRLPDSAEPALVGKRTLSFRDVLAAGRPTVERRALVIARPDEATAITLLTLLHRNTGFALAHAAWTEAELRDVIARVKPSVIFDSEHSERTTNVERTTHAEPANEQVIVFSSGTTGQPKGARLGREALLAAARAHDAALPFAPHDRWLLSLSPARVGGLSVITRSLWARRPVVLPAPGGFDPDRFMAHVAATKTTLLSLVPAQLRKLLDAGHGPGPVRAVLLGGAACPEALLARGRAAGWPLLPTYGMSETCAQACTQRLEDPRALGVGPPLPGVEMRLSNDAIEVRGSTLMHGYLGEPPHDGWFRTGDLGRWEDDHLVVTGRAGDRIVSGGENVDPAEVEAALLAHPEIAEACVVGVPDETWGEVVTAVVVSNPIGLEAIRAHLEARLARYKHPRALCRWESLPRGPMGKLRRSEVRAELGARNPDRSDPVPER